MFDTKQNCVKIDEHRQLEQQAAYYNGNNAKQRKTTEKHNMSVEVLNGAVFFYTCIQTPTKKYESEATEWKTNAVVDKKTAKEWNKRFAKQKAKEMDNEEFVAKYKCDVPFPDQEEQYIIKLSQNTHNADGKEMYQPKVYQDIGGNNVIDITKKKLVGNGSKGKAAYGVVENKFGTFAKLNSICIFDLVEYGGNANPFGNVVEDENDAAQREAYSPKPVKPEPKPKPAPLAEDLDDSDDSLPF